MFDGHGGGFLPAILQISLSPDEAHAATASWDGTAKVWDVVTGEEIFTLEGHSGEVWAVTFSPDGTRLATASADGTAKIWDAVSGRQLLTLSGHTGVVTGLAFSPDGKRLATAAEDQTVRVFALDIDDLIRIAEDRVTRSLTPEEERQYLHLDG